MTHFLEKRDPWGHGMARWILVVMVVLIPPACWAITQIHVENDVENWLPDDDPQARILDWYRAHFPVEDRVLISWKGSSLSDPRVERLAHRLVGFRDRDGIRRDGVKQVEAVVTPQELLDRMVQQGVARDEALRRLQGVLIGPGRSEAPVALSVALSEAGIADKSGTLRALRNAAVEVGIDKDNLALGGRAVVASALNEAVKRTARNRDVPLWMLPKRSPVLLSLLVGVGLAFLMLRSGRLATLVLIAAVYTVLLSLAVVPATHGNMNMVLVVMPTLLGVLTVSAAIHVANYWKHAAGRNLRTAVVEATNMARQPCLLAGLTTAIGLLSLTVSPLVPVRDFGLYSAVGCLISVIVVLYALPALMQFWPGGPPRQTELDRTGWHRLGSFLARHRTSVTVLCLAAFVLSTCGLLWFRTETKVIRYFPQHARVVQDYRFLEDNLAGVVPVDVIVRFDQHAQRESNFLQRLEIVRQLEDRIREHPGISGTMSLADFLPFSSPPPRGAGFLQKAQYHKRANQIETEIKQHRDTGARTFFAVDESSTVQSPNAGPQASTLNPQLSTLNTRKHSAPNSSELWRITAHTAVLSDMNYGRLTADLKATATAVLNEHPGTGSVVTGMVPLFLRTQQAVLESLIKSFALAFAVIALVMIVLLRSPLAGLITMLPNLLPIGLVFGLISWNGLAVDVGTMITASVALGIAVDGTLHLLTWFRSGLSEGLSRQQAVAKALAHCGPAMWQTSAAVGLGLLTLFPTELLLISRFGWLMAALIGVALLGDVIFLPALLAGPLGTLIERSNKPRQTVLRPARTHFRASAPQPHLPLQQPASRPQCAENDTASAPFQGPGE